MRAILQLVFTIVPLLISAPAYSKEVVGWIENVAVYDSDQNIVMRAKIDTGAQTTSVHSADYTIFNKMGKEWVRFTLTNHEGRTISLEEPVVRYTKIKRHFTQSQTRPVINLGLCLGNKFHITEVNLVDRGKFEYKLLVGRSLLAKGILVDSAEKDMTTPVCKVK